MKKIYWTYANAVEQVLGFLDSERKDIQKLCLGQEFHEWIEDKVTRTSIVENLLKFKETLEIFSYSGHADGEHLLTEDDASHMEGIAGLLGSCPKIKIILLNGCGTKTQVDYLRSQGISVVIYTHSKVDDDLAKIFAVTFFTSFLGGSTVNKSFIDAKSAVKVAAGSNARRICFRSYRGLDFNKAQPNEWGIYYKDAIYEDCTLNNWHIEKESFFGKPEHKEKFKVFFLGDQLIYSTLSMISNLNSENDQSNRIQTEIIWQGRSSIRNKSEDFEAATQIVDADAVLLCVHGESFIEDIWKNSYHLIEKIVEYKKPVLYLDMDFDEELNFHIKQKIKDNKIHSLISKKLPNLYQMIINDNEQKKAFRNRIKSKIMEAENIIKRGGILNDFLHSSLMEFDLKSQFDAYSEIIFKEKHLHLICIEGTQNCGQDFLFKRIKESLPKKFNKLPIDFQAHHIYDGSINKLLDVIFEQFRKPRYFEDIDQNINYLITSLLDEPRILFFDNIFTSDMAPFEIEKTIDLIKKFWSKLCKSMPHESKLNPDHQIFIFVVNRCYDGVKRFDFTDINVPSSAIAEALPPIEKITDKDIKYWYNYKQHLLRSTKYDQLKSEFSKILNDGYLDNVLIELCERLGYDKQKLLA